MKKKELQDCYNNLFEKYGLESSIDTSQIGIYVNDILERFLENKTNPALFANGIHTKMLLTDYVFTLKKVKIIVDNYYDGLNKDGYRIITAKDIIDNKIDGVIISSFKYRDEIKEELLKKCPGIPTLDIYAELEKKGIKLYTEYYKNFHPHHYYHIINNLNLSKKDEKVYLDLINKYLQIKDFRMALITAKAFSDEYSSAKTRELKADIEKLYNLELDAIRTIHNRNVLLLCLDGFRRRDLNQKLTPRLHRIVSEKGYYYSRTYSYSTSTFESMLPVFAEDYDYNSCLYQIHEIPEGKCRFITKALAQERDIFFYTDMDCFISSDRVSYVGQFQTLTQKIWSYVLDALECSNGLFLIHELYETHYSFSNPYADYKLISEGTAMLFDYLPQNGGRLRTDYVKQHDDALRYVDDTLGDFLNIASNPIILYADHGNLLLDKSTDLNGISEMSLLCSDEWTEVPLVVLNQAIGECASLNSLGCLNDLVINILEQKTIPSYQPKGYIKMGRSEIYNPDFKRLYKLMGYERDLMAFECFVFESGIKLVVYSDGTIRFFKSDKEINPEGMDYKKMIEMIRKDVTVCRIS